jgi:septum formation protein
MTWLNLTDHIVLASASPRRLALLEQIQVPVKQLILPSPPGEDEPRLPNEPVTAYVNRTAQDKLARALAHLSGTGLADHQAVLSADTTVALGQEILAKPVDDLDAHRMLSTLSNQTHQVYTAVCLAWDDNTFQALSMSSVRFAPLTPEQIQFYIQTKEPFGKAGGYAIQGIAARFVEHLEGSFSGVMGLPIYETTQLLCKAGLMK